MTVKPIRSIINDPKITHTVGFNLALVTSSVPCIKKKETSKTMSNVYITTFCYQNNNTIFLQTVCFLILQLFVIQLVLGKKEDCFQPAVCEVNWSKF